VAAALAHRLGDVTGAQGTIAAWNQRSEAGGHLNLTVATRAPLFYAALDDSV
jgi:hypothetical protein